MGWLVCAGSGEDGLRIALDLDGLLADLHSVLLETFSEIANVINRVRNDRLVLAGKGNGSHKLAVGGECTVFIDDNPDLAGSAPSGILVLLYSEPWNQQFCTPTKNRSVIRIRSLSEVPEILHRPFVKLQIGTK
jgi:hypothetical protein